MKTVRNADHGALQKPAFCCVQAECAQLVGVLRLYVQQYCGTPSFMWHEMQARTLIAEWEVRCRKNVLAIGELCAGTWIGPPDASLRQWHCRCGAQRPEQCVTETAEKPKAVKLVYNKTTKRIDKVRTGDGLVLESFEPPIEE